MRGLGNALFVVDGLPRDPSILNLSEIEQVSVLKDGHAAMLWGSAAKNGVIQITTKRGKALKRKVGVSVDQGIGLPVALPEYLGSAKYFELYNEALVNDGLAPSRNAATIALYDGSNPYRYPDVDYYSSEYLKSMVPVSRVLTEFGGGNENTQYYANVGWNRSGQLYKLGEAAKMGTNRFNMRSNVDFKINDFIKSTLDGVFIVTYGRNPAGNFWNDASTLHPHYYSPLLPVSMIDNTTALQDQLAVAKKINGEYILGGTGQFMSNPYGNMFLAGYVENNARTATISNTIDVSLDALLEGLSFKTFFSYDAYNTYASAVNNVYAVYSPTWNAENKITGLQMINQDRNTGEKNMPIAQRYFERRLASYAMFDYRNTFQQAHTVSAVLLGYYNKTRYNNALIDGKNAHLGLRIGYDFNKKYYADFSSTYTNGFYLKPGSKGGFAPSLGLGWVMSEEDFLGDSKVVDFLKIRASAAIQNLDLNYLGTGYPYEQSYIQAGMNFDFGNVTRSTQTYIATRMANNNLTFEKMKSINVGFDGYFFNRSLYAEGNVFSNWWTGQVVRPASIYPAYLSYYYPFENYNSTRYSGVELGLVYAKSYGELSFELGTNFMYTASKRTKVLENFAFDYQNRQGKPTDVIFGLEALGLFKDTPDIDGSDQQKYSIVKPGDIKYMDQNNDDIINANDQIEIGNALPRISYGINLLVRYKGLSLMAAATGYGGYDYIQGGDYFWVDGNKKYSAEVLNRWTPATASSASYPRLSTQSNTNNYQNSTYWLKRGNFFSLNRVQLTYHFPQSFLSQWIMRELSVYLRGSNLGMFCPDADKRQLNIGFAPSYRIYAAGVNVAF
jgi:TonB-linked SusC/RagA family outer membrane protein